MPRYDFVLLRLDIVWLSLDFKNNTRYMSEQLCQPSFIIRHSIKYFRKDVSANFITQETTMFSVRENVKLVKSVRCVNRSFQSCIVILHLANSIKVVIQSARSLTLSVSRQKVNVSPVRLVPDRDAAAVASRDGELVVEVDAAGLWRVR